jgi:hypothetical protein
MIARAGQIIVDFPKPHEALEKLRSLAMAVGNDHESVDRIALATE